MVAERKGFPPAETKSIAHVHQKMWLKAIELRIGFMLLTMTGMLSAKPVFMAELGNPNQQRQSIDSRRVVEGHTHPAALEAKISWLCIPSLCGVSDTAAPYSTNGQRIGDVGQRVAFDQ